MKIEVGNVYEAQEERNGIATGDLVYVGKLEKDLVTFWKDKERVHFNYKTEIFENVFSPYVAEVSSKPAHYDTAIDTIAFAKANFSREQVEGFMRINAIKYLQRAGKKDSVLSNLTKARHYIDMLIEMEEEKDEN